MNGKLKKNLGLSLLPIAFLFLFEPGFTIIDPLPDFIGYIIISSAIINLADINHRIAEAVSGFRKGIIISLCRFLAIYLLKSYFIESELSVGLLLFVFVFSFFELVILIPAYRSLFEGLLSLGVHHDGNVIFYKNVRKKKTIDPVTGERIIQIKEGSRNLTEKTYFFTMSFLIIKCLAVTLPEFTSLTNNTAYEFVGVVRILGVALVLPVGIAWLITVISYFVRVSRDTPYIKSLASYYLLTVAEKPNFFTVRKLTVGLYAMLVAFIFSSDFYANHTNLIPDCLFYVILIVAAVMLHKFSKKWKLLVAVSSLGIVSSLLSLISSKKLYASPDFYPAAIRKDLDAYYAYYRMLSYHIIDAVVFVLTVAILLLLLWDIYKVHSDLAVAESRNEYVEHKSRYVKWAITIISMAVVSAGGTVYYIFAQPFESDGNWLFHYAAIISIAISATYTFFAVYFIGFLNNSIKSRYRIDI